MKPALVVMGRWECIERTCIGSQNGPEGGSPGGKGESEADLGSGRQLRGHNRASPETNPLLPISLHRRTFPDREPRRQHPGTPPGWHGPCPPPQESVALFWMVVDAGPGQDFGEVKRRGSWRGFPKKTQPLWLSHCTFAPALGV